MFVSVCLSVCLSVHAKTEKKLLNINWTFYPYVFRAVEMGFNNLGFRFYVILEKNLKIQILDLQSQQRIVAFQSNWL